MSEPVVSTLGDDPDLGGLVDEYVAGLADRMADIERAAAAGDRGRLEVLAHQMVGSAGMYGFRTISDAAQRVEVLAPEGSAELLTTSIGELAALSARARAR